MCTLCGDHTPQGESPSPSKAPHSGDKAREQAIMAREERRQRASDEWGHIWDDDH